MAYYFLHVYCLPHIHDIVVETRFKLLFFNKKNPERLILDRRQSGLTLAPPDSDVYNENIAYTAHPRGERRPIIQRRASPAER